jgi:hypothetical protein
VGKQRICERKFGASPSRSPRANSAVSSLRDTRAGKNIRSLSMRRRQLKEAAIAGWHPKPEPEDGKNRIRVNYPIVPGIRHKMYSISYCFYPV